MPDTKKPKLQTPKMAYELGLTPVVPFPTPFSPGGKGVSLSFKVGLNKNHKRFSLGLDFRYLSLDSALHEYSNSDVGMKSYSLRALLSQSKLKPLGKGKPWGFFRTETDRWIGFGRTWQPGFNWNPSGESIGASEAGEYGLDIGMTIRGGLDINLNTSIQLFLGGEFSLGARYAPGDTLFSSLHLQLGFILSFVFGAGKQLGHKKDEELSKMGVGTAMAFKAIALGQRLAIESVLTGAVQDARDYGLMGGGGEPGSLFHVPMILAANAFMGGAGKNTDLGNFMSISDGWKWAIFGAELLGTLFLLSKASKGSAMGDLLNAGNMLVYAGYKIHTPKARKALSKKELAKRAKNALIWRYVLGTLLTGIGLGAGSGKPGDTWALAPLQGGMQGTVATAISPIPFSAKGVGANRVVNLIPITGYWSKDKSGRRGGFSIRSELKDSSILVGANLMTPSFSALNIANLAQPGEQYDDTTVESQIQSYIGLYKRWKYFMIYGALTQTMLMGGSGIHPGGFGVRGGIELTIPIMKVDLILGGECGVSYLPEDSWQAECVPHIGLRFK
jgi:hypothetical protein